MAEVVALVPPAALRRSASPTVSDTWRVLRSESEGVALQLGATEGQTLRCRPCRLSWVLRAGAAVFAIAGLSLIVPRRRRSIAMRTNGPQT